MRTLTFATANAHKVEEIKSFFADLPVVIQSLQDFPHLPDAPEPYDTFEENALSKAQFLQPHTQGLVIADDSGLEVDHLNGRPGVHSKRYSLEGTAQANNSKLLQEMNDSSTRSARFRCVLAIYDGTTHHFIQGTCEGEIGTETIGSEGFGYDPIFIPTGMNGLSMAQISMTEKNEVSHRGRALKGLKQWLLQNPTGF